MSSNIKLVFAFGLLMAFISQVTMYGNSVQIPIDDPEMLELMHRHEREMDSQRNSPFIHRITKVFKVRKQLVNGFNYFVDFQFGQTDCLKENNPNIADCNTYTRYLPCFAHIYVTFKGKNTLVHLKCKIPI